MNAPPPRRRLSKERRSELRDELYARVAAGDISIGEVVKLMRRITGRTQPEFARLVGVSPRILVEIERGIANPTVRTLHKVLAPLDLEISVRRRTKHRADAEKAS